LITAVPLHDLGWTEELQRTYEGLARDGMLAARVVAQHRGGYLVLTERGSISATLGGRLRRDEAPASDRPAVGDWTAVTLIPGEPKALVHQVLPRKSAISRKVAGLGTDEQVLAANIDTIFLVSSLNSDLNLRRIERYLTIGWESGAVPVIVLTKSDLTSDVTDALLQVESIAPAVGVHAVSNLTGDGFEALVPYLQSGLTVALLGSSGVGKSSLVNRLLGEERQVVREIREDDRGRHTTSHRELLVVPGGGFIIDTPGMRELQLWDSADGVERAFSDIVELAAECRFGDCVHETEPGCAVKAALQDGTLRRDRLESFRKLEKELRYLERRQNRRTAAEETRRVKRLSRQMRQEPFHSPYT
jgi:ribosome biogenesis GTPase / thiamine phosphate phosphatase